MAVSEKDIQDFQRDGAVILHNVFTQEWVEKVIKGIAANKANPSQYSENLRGPQGPGSYFNDYCNWTSIPEFRDFVYNSPAAQLAGVLMQSKYAVFYHEHVLTKDAATFKNTPWHHDQAYYPVDGFKNCSIWMPVDHVPLETTIQFVAGSHRWGRWFYPRKFATTLNYEICKPDNTDRIYENIPDIDNNIDNYRILKWEVQPGDCVVFHMLTVHGAPSNTTPTPRRVLSTRWLGDDCVLAERPWEVSPPILGGLKPGDPIINDVFPLIWCAEETNSQILL